MSTTSMEPQPPVPPEDARKSKVVVRNMPPSFRDQAVFEAFLRGRLGEAPTSVDLVRRPALYAFVAFASDAGREGAVSSLNGLEVEGHALAVELAERPDPERNVYISLIPQWVGREKVLELASNCGSIASFYLMALSPRYPGTLAMLVQMRTKEEAHFLIRSLHDLEMVHDGKEFKISCALRR